MKKILLFSIIVSTISLHCMEKNNSQSDLIPQLIATQVGDIHPIMKACLDGKDLHLNLEVHVPACEINIKSMENELITGPAIIKINDDGSSELITLKGQSDCKPPAPQLLFQKRILLDHSVTPQLLRCKDATRFYNLKWLMWESAPFKIKVTKKIHKLKSYNKGEKWNYAFKSISYFIDTMKKIEEGPNWAHESTIKNWLESQKNNKAFQTKLTKAQEVLTENDTLDQDSMEYALGFLYQLRQHESKIIEAIKERAQQLESSPNQEEK